MLLNKINKEIFYIKNYKNPKDLEYKKPNTFKNLILIFFESAEKDLPNFSIKVENDQGSIEEYIDNEYIYEPIKEFNNYEIENFVQAESLGWSMAGMAAAQCGIPIYNLNRSFKEKNILSNNKKSTCIGDILKDFGYKQFFFTSGRIELWKYTINKYFENPILGKGPGSFFIMSFIDVIYNDHPFEKAPSQPHNMILQFLIEWGIIGTSIILILLIKILIKSLEILIKYKKLILLIPGLTLIKLTIHGMIDGTFFHPTFTFIIVLLLSILCFEVRKFIACKIK